MEEDKGTKVRRYEECHTVEGLVCGGVIRDHDHGRTIKLGVQALDAHIITDLLRGLLTLFFDPAISGLVGFKLDPLGPYASSSHVPWSNGRDQSNRCALYCTIKHRNSLAPSLGLRKTNDSFSSSDEGLVLYSRRAEKTSREKWKTRRKVELQIIIGRIKRRQHDPTSPEKNRTVTRSGRNLLPFGDIITAPMMLK
ncbi:hypothetical protein OIU84_006970 [Salix udensis]|uniref:Uncharacterized protein n=1 Tax=Salix udensis TaxID=889485 RepID=A0AAD6JZM8_9ROSI|nr:hypothetical protein OIU84_006970 [Salix udensis]